MLFGDGGFVICVGASPCGPRIPCFCLFVVFCTHTHTMAPEGEVDVLRERGQVGRPTCIFLHGLRKASLRNRTAAGGTRSTRCCSEEAERRTNWCRGAGPTDTGHGTNIMGKGRLSRATTMRRRVTRQTRKKFGPCVHIIVLCVLGDV